MTTRERAPLGAPCWVDLWTSDPERSRHFYSSLFGWEAGEANPDFGGYFMFNRNGNPIAGAMGDMGDMSADNTWKPYFSAENVDITLERAGAQGGIVLFPTAKIADLGSQAVIADPSGAVTGIWQGDSFHGFSAIHEHGTPSFIAIDVPNYESEIAFYRSVFTWDPEEEEVDGHHYAGFMDKDSSRPIAGIGDEIENLAPGEAPHWTVFWQVDDVDAAVATVQELGGSVRMAPANRGLGRVALVADPCGAQFKLFSPGRPSSD